MSKTAQFTCASCGAPLPVRSSANVFLCGYCGTSQMVFADSGGGRSRSVKAPRDGSHAPTKAIVTERDITLGGKAGEFPAPAGMLNTSNYQPASTNNIYMLPMQNTSIDWRTYRGSKTILTFFWCLFFMLMVGIFAIGKLPDMVVAPIVMIGVLGFPVFSILYAYSHWKGCRNGYWSF